jgi:atypical dual specificity phosphatase
MFQSITPPQTVSEYYGPRGFHWLEPGLLGGCARPGIVADTTSDLAALQRVGTRLLVSLTEEWQPDVELLGGYGIDSIYFPIPDREAPEIDRTEALCAELDARLRDGEAVVFHCRAGKGRTGTLLASQLIWNGMAAAEAVAYVRAKHRSWIETEAQIEFLEDFAAIREVMHLGP